MKLRNKKTGEIGLVHCDATMFSNKIGVFIDNNHIDLCNPYKIYTSLAELNEEWCDYKEPKGTYFINTQGDVQFWDSSSFAYPDDWTKEKEIGNYFETKEEAEKAVEKLKAWHKLMDYWGTEVLGWEIRDMPTGGNWQTVNVKFNVKTKKEPMELLDIVFGGEE